RSFAPHSAAPSRTANRRSPRAPTSCRSRRTSSTKRYNQRAVVVTFCSSGGDSPLACALAVAGVFADRELATLLVHSSEHEKAVANWRAERTLRQRPLPTIVHLGDALPHAQLASMARAFEVALVVRPTRDRKEALEAADLVIVVWAGASDDALLKVESDVLEI